MDKSWIREEIMKINLMNVKILFILLVVGVIFISGCVQEREPEPIKCGECQYLENGECKNYECCENSDCDDNDPDTDDICLNPQTKDSKCETTVLRSENCKDVIINGDVENKMDVVFVPDYSYSQYSDFNIFEKDVNENIETILEIEPFKSMSNKMNFYRVDKINKKVKCGLSNAECNQPALELASECPQDKVIVLVKSGISGFALGNVAVGSSCDDSALDFYGNDIGCPYDLSTDRQRITTVHEFGHTLGLADMYIQMKNLSNRDRFPNCDVKGCPKWCSSYDLSNYKKASQICQSRTQTNCSGSALNKYDESGNYIKTLYRCGWLGDNCVVRTGYENVGRGCLPNTGCYFNCGSLLGWRPVEEGTIMMHENPEDTIFDPISYNYLVKELNKYK